MLICKIEDQSEKLININEINNLEIQHKKIKLKEKNAVVDEMWSFVEKKKQQRWLWHAIDQVSGKVLGYVFGERSDDEFD